MNTESCGGNADTRQIQEETGRGVPGQDSGTYPQAVKKIGTGVGSVTQMDNSVHTTTSDAVDRISSVGVQIQVWAETPERRNALDGEIDTAMQEIGITRSGASHFAEARGDDAYLFRSALMYSGAYDNVTKEYYTK